MYKAFFIFLYFPHKIIECKVTYFQIILFFVFICLVVTYIVQTYALPFIGIQGLIFVYNFNNFYSILTNHLRFMHKIMNHKWQAKYDFGFYDFHSGVSYDPWFVKTIPITQVLFNNVRWKLLSTAPGIAFNLILTWNKEICVYTMDTFFCYYWRTSYEATRHRHY